MCTLRAPECLAALAIASATAKYAADSTGAGRRPGRSMSAVVATGVSAPSARRASPRPRSASTGGLIPATRPRSSASARAEFSRAAATRATAASGSVLISPSVARREMPSAISRAWAPSCRSRSTRRSSAAAVPTASTRVAVSRRTRLTSSVLRLASPERGPIVRGTSHTPKASITRPAARSSMFGMLRVNSSSWNG